jgi:hypothetical protein
MAPRARSSPAWIFLAVALLVPGTLLLWAAVRQSTASKLAREVTARAEREVHVAQNFHRPRAVHRGEARPCGATRELSAVLHTLQSSAQAPRGDFNPIIERAEPIPDGWTALVRAHGRELDALSRALQCDHGANLAPLNADGYSADNLGAMVRASRMMIVRALQSPPDACLAGLVDVLALSAENAWGHGLIGAVLHDGMTKPVPAALFRCAAQATPEARARAANALATVARSQPADGRWVHGELTMLSLGLARALRDISAMPSQRQDIPLWWDRPRALEILNDVVKGLDRWERLDAAGDPRALERELAATESLLMGSEATKMVTTQWTQRVQNARAGRARVMMTALVLNAWAARDASGAWSAELPALGREPAMRDPFTAAPFGWSLETASRQLTVTAAGADGRAGTGDDVIVTFAAP